MTFDWPETMAQYRYSGLLGKIKAAAGSGMIRMGVGNDRSCDRSPWVDVKIACGAVKAAVCQFDESHYAGSEGLLAYS